MMRQKVFIDLKSKINPLRNVSSQINLNQYRVIRIPLKFLLSGFLVSVVITSFIFNFAIAPIDIEAKAAQENAANLEAERVVLEEQLEKYEKEISDLEGKISENKKLGKTLNSEITRLNSLILKANIKIKAINLNIKTLNAELNETQSKIKTTQSEVDDKKESISVIIQNIYENEKKGNLAMLLSNLRISNLFIEANNLANIQANLSMSLRELVELQNKLSDHKQTLALEKNDAEKLAQYQASQKLTIQKTQEEKSNLLKVTKGKESEYQKSLEATKKAAAEIRSRIFRMLGGGELPFGEAVKIAQVAEKSTGVRAAFILSILTQESSVDGVIGANLGKCYYNTPRSNKSGTVMSNTQKPAFLRIMSELKMDPEKTPVSCPIASDGAYGGAMGPAQFMPTTWELYENRISEITGGNPASPFNNLDAFTATALYLKDGLTSCQQTYKTLFSQENCAAAKYYSGARYRSYMSVGRYGYRVADRSAKFQEDIETLSA